MEQISIKYRNLFFLPKSKRFQMMALLSQTQWEVAKKVVQTLSRIWKWEDVRNEGDIIDTKALDKEIENERNNSWFVWGIKQLVEWMIQQLQLGKMTRWASWNENTELVTAAFQKWVLLTGNIYSNWLYSVIKRPDWVQKERFMEVEPHITAAFIFSDEYKEKPEYYEYLRLQAYQSLIPESIPDTSPLWDQENPEEQIHIQKITPWAARWKILWLYKFDALNAWKVAIDEAEIIDFSLYSVLFYVMGNDRRYQYCRADFEPILSAYDALPESETEKRRMFEKNLRYSRFIDAIITDFSLKYPWLEQFNKKKWLDVRWVSDVELDKDIDANWVSRIRFSELLYLPENMRARIFSQCNQWSLRLFLHGIMQGRVDPSMRTATFTIEDFRTQFSGDIDTFISIIEKIRAVRSWEKNIIQLLQSLLELGGLSMEILILWVSKIQSDETWIDLLQEIINSIPASVFWSGNQLRLQLNRELQRFWLRIEGDISDSAWRWVSHDWNPRWHVTFQEASSWGLSHDLAGKLARWELDWRFWSTSKRGSRKHGFQSGNKLAHMWNSEEY